ncbi:MAG: hypothetical protein IJU23_09685 [Proteobacteria bacterium]|nr:hypothetical protein [Pseudomonadota bacterium]
MQVSDFLQKYLTQDAVVLTSYEANITSHFDASLRQLWPEGRILIVTESAYREYVETTLLPALDANGRENAYCLCVKTPGTTYQAQIDESLGDGVVDGLTGIASLGSCDLFKAVRDRASILNVACCALLNELPGTDLFDACGENRPCADALFFDLDSIDHGLHGDLREVVQFLEVDIYALKADIATWRSLGKPVPACVIDALNEALPPRIPLIGVHSEDDLAQLCEAYVWRAAAARLLREEGSLKTVLDYARACADYQDLPIAQHARLMAMLFDSVMELESLEISPEESAAHQPPRDILKRTLQQTLLDDGVNLSWIKRADENYLDRNSLRLMLNTLVMNWDDYCAKIRPIADMMHAICAQNPYYDDEDNLDASLKNTWIHAARFAGNGTFIKIYNALGLIEPSLFV